MIRAVDPHKLAADLLGRDFENLAQEFRAHRWDADPAQSGH